MHEHMNQRRTEYYNEEKKREELIKKSNNTSKSVTFEDDFPSDSTESNSQIKIQKDVATRDPIARPEVESFLKKMPHNDLNILLEELYYKALAKAKETLGDRVYEKQELEKIVAAYADELLVDYCSGK
jgi:hypothetical protein